MSTIELNIGLDIEGQPNEGPAITERDRAVRALLRHIDPQASMYRTDTSYQRDGETVHENVLVAKLADASYRQLDALGAALGAVFGQDCYAAYCPDTGDGQLIGPRADQWGEFNPAFFIRFLGATE